MRTIRSSKCVCLAASSAKGTVCHQKPKSRLKARNKLRIIPHHLLSQYKDHQSFLKQLQHIISTCGLPTAASAHNAPASPLHSWWLMGNSVTAIAMTSKKSAKAMNKIMLHEDGEEELSPCASSSNVGSFHLQRVQEEKQRCSDNRENVIEWKFLETSMEDGLLGRGALSPTESGSWNLCEERKSQKVGGGQAWKDPVSSKSDVGDLRKDSCDPSHHSEHISSSALFQAELREDAIAADNIDEEGHQEGDEEEEYSPAHCFRDATDDDEDWEDYCSGRGYDHACVSKRWRNQWKRQKSFPPPLSSRAAAVTKASCSHNHHLPHQKCSTVLQLQAIRSRGRFVLQQVEVAPQIHFQPIRTNNRLVLQLIRPPLPQQENLLQLAEPRHRQPLTDLQPPTSNPTDNALVEQLPPFPPPLTIAVGKVQEQLELVDMAVQRPPQSTFSKNASAANDTDYIDGDDDMSSEKQLVAKDGYSDHIPSVTMTNSTMCLNKIRQRAKGREAAGRAMAMMEEAQPGNRPKFANVTAGNPTACIGHHPHGARSSSSFSAGAMLDKYPIIPSCNREGHIIRRPRKYPYEHHILLSALMKEGISSIRASCGDLQNSTHGLQGMITQSFLRLSLSKLVCVEALQNQHDQQLHHHQSSSCSYSHCKLHSDPCLLNEEDGGGAVALALPVWDRPACIALRS